MKHKQKSLFGDKYNFPQWEKEWKGMPEFIQEDLTSKRKIIVHFKNEEDVVEFSKLINQTILPKTKSIWFPEIPIRYRAHMRYIDES